MEEVIHSIQKRSCLRVLLGHSRTFSRHAIHNNELISGSYDATVCIRSLDILVNIASYYKTTT